MSETAVLLFVRSEQDEIRHKRLIKSNKTGNQDVIRVLNNRIVRTVGATHLSYFIIDSRHQLGSAFSERLQNAFTQIFDLGFQRVISVGNDIPNLRAEHILDAERELERSDLCYGRTQKHGVYLFGMTREMFHNLDFAAIKWQESELISSIQLSLQCINARWVELEEQLHELNNASDLNQFVHLSLNAKTDYLLRFLNELLGRQNQFFSYNCLLRSNLNTSNFLLRGPPLAI